MKPNRPVVLGLTLGDPGGIGPEVALKAAGDKRWPAHLKLVLVGSAQVVKSACKQFGVPAPPLWSPEQETQVPAITMWEPRPAGGKLVVKTGQCTVAGARAAVGWIKAAVEAAQAGALDGIVTGPICKKGMVRAGIPFPGHTEMLASLTGTRDFAMMLIGEPLRVVLVTRHIPLAEVPKRLDAAKVRDTVTLAGAALKWLGVRNATVGVCALNPHGGDGGAIGREETTIIAPALRALRRRGIAVEGPIPGDVIFHQAMQGRFGAVVAMYHDQGLGPLKMLAFDRGVNITLGLPILRTSPDHGTAFDIAGKGCADPRSMVEAVALALRLAGRPNPWGRPARKSDRRAV